MLVPSRPTGSLSTHRYAPAMTRRKADSRNCPFFALRCLLSLGLTAGVWIGTFHALGERSLQPSAAESAVAARAVVPSMPLDPALPSIIIDPGHGGTDPGTVAGGEYEKTWTLKVSTALADELRRRGWPVELTRTDDAAVPLPDRAGISNRQPRLAFVSIHFNAGGVDATGVETYYAWPKNPEVMARIADASVVPAGMAVRDDRGLLLAGLLQSSVCAATGSKNRSARNDPALAVLNRTQCPAVLVECGFLTNPAECESIKSDAWRGKLVRGLADGLESWLRASLAKGYGIVMENTPASEPAAGVGTP